MKQNLTVFSLVGILYVFIEVGFTAIEKAQLSLIGQSSLWMMLVGGLMGVVLGKLNSFDSFMKRNHFVNILIGATAITLMELISGIVLNIWLGFNIWDYSESSINFLGQIDLLHSICWILITPFAYWIDDVIKYYIYQNPKPKPVICYYYRNVRGY